ncbi:MAG: xanthine dehydrogenase family protein subunit M [Alphaproteobacteria bacterium]|nr:xanthine dehydrogenase family protein subunit M [Alphaproteobacteria bacterium]
MKPAPFQYERPETIDGVLAVLNQYGEESKILAGGQSLIAMMNTRVLQPRVVVDISRVPTLDTLDVEDDTLIIGALVCHSEIAASSMVREASPLIVETYPHVAHRPIRNRGTLVGNLAHADPASEMPAVMLVSGARLTLRSQDNLRSLPADDFFLSPFETAARADELLTEIHIPVAPPGQGWGFREFSPRKGDFALASVATTMDLVDGKIDSVRLACAGVGPCAQRLADVEGPLSGATPGPEAFAAAAENAAAAIDPQEDFHADAAYRRDLISSLVKRSLADAFGRCANT